jgi:intracellular multiplication protein IcmK
MTMKFKARCLLQVLIGLSLFVAWFSTTALRAAEADGSSQATLQSQLQKIAREQRTAPPRQASAPTRAPTTAPTKARNTMAPQVQVLSPSGRAVAANPQSQGANSVSTGKDLGQDAFAATLRQMMPMTPEQIKMLHRVYNAARMASAYGVNTPPKPTASSKSVDLSPGATPPVIRLASGYISSLVFVDATGAPWPIKAYDLGDSRAYNIQWDKQGNTLMLQAITQYKAANLAVMLKGCDTPVMLTLIPAQQQVDYRVDLRIPRMGPNAKLGQIQALPAAVSPILLSVLDGLKPVGGRLVDTVGGEAQTWLVGEQMYVRTPLTVISPGWVSMVSSADGMHAYLLPKASVVLATDHGKMVQLKLEGF